MKHLRWFCALAMVATLSAANGVQAANLLNNGGFEDPLGFDFSNPLNWNGFFGGPPGTVLEAFNDTGAPAFAGSQALELTISAGVFEGQPVNGSNSFTGHVQNVPGIAGGDPITAGIWARNNGSDLTADTEFRVEFRDGVGEISRTQIEISGLLTDEYQFFEIDAIAPVGTTNVNLVAGVASFNQDVPHNHSVALDNASLAVIPEPTGLLLVGLASLGLLASRRER